MVPPPRRGSARARPTPVPRPPSIRVPPFWKAATGHHALGGKQQPYGAWTTCSSATRHLPALSHGTSRDTHRPAGAQQSEFLAITHFLNSLSKTVSKAPSRSSSPDTRPWCPPFPSAGTGGACGGVHAAPPLRDAHPTSCAPPPPGRNSRKPEPVAAAACGPPGRPRGTRGEAGHPFTAILGGPWVGRCLPQHQRGARPGTAWAAPTGGRTGRLCFR